MKIISLGAGVQSSTLSLMASCGEFEKPDCAIFADTGWEPRTVYDWIEWLEKQLDFPVYRVIHGNLRYDLIKKADPNNNDRVVSIPAFIWNGGIGRRQCTREYKIQPITKKIRALGGGLKNPVELWIGISLDEIRRMKPNRTKWIANRWPLIELRMNRQNCLKWMTDHGYPRPPKSSCLGCPFHDDTYWRNLKDKSRSEWDETVAIDHIIRRLPGFDHEQYLHRSLMPLDEVDLTIEEDYGQLDMFDSECEGMCGL